MTAASPNSSDRKNIKGEFTARAIPAKMIHITTLNMILAFTIFTFSRCNISNDDSKKP
jgi:hypothetical protein